MISTATTGATNNYAATRCPLFAVRSALKAAGQSDSQFRDRKKEVQTSKTRTKNCPAVLSGEREAFSGKRAAA